MVISIQITGTDGKKLAQSKDNAKDYAIVDAVFARARAAQEKYAQKADQARYDQAALAAAWAVMEPTRNRELATLAVATTGFGNVEDKISKNHRKTLGLLRDIKDAKTCGIIRELPDQGITEIARPMGVIGAVVPATNPVATPLNNVINALKCGNGIVLSPSPMGEEACELLVQYIHGEFARSGIDPDLVQMLPSPASKVKTQRLMVMADLLVVTGSQDNVRRAYSSGTPALGVGAGNVAVIVDETANLQDAAGKITRSKCFDNATSCSSENALIVVDAIYEKFIAALTWAGGYVADDAMADEIVEKLWLGGKLNRDVIGRNIEDMVAALGLAERVPPRIKFIAVPTSGIGAEYPLSGEKLSLVMAVYRAKNFADAKAIAQRLLDHQGAGHSLGLHSMIGQRAVELGHDMPTCRVIVNQAHCFATGGAFDNGMPFSLSMGGGSWGGNSIDCNLNWRHFMNITKVVRTITPNEPVVDDIFAEYWQQLGGQ